MASVPAARPSSARLARTMRPGNKLPARSTNVPVARKCMMMPMGPLAALTVTPWITHTTAVSASPAARAEQKGSDENGDVRGVIFKERRGRYRAGNG